MNKVYAHINDGREHLRICKAIGAFIRNLKLSISFDLKYHSWEYVLRKVINMESFMY